MRYQFMPQNRVGATTIVFPEHRVSFVPGVAELDDAVWDGIKDQPEIQDLLQTETLRVLSSASVVAPVAATPKTVKPTKPE